MRFSRPYWRKTRIDIAFRILVKLSRLTNLAASNASNAQKLRHRAAEGEIKIFSANSAPLRREKFLVFRFLKIQLGTFYFLQAGTRLLALMH
jgi:hypothetical protein